MMPSQGVPRYPLRSHDLPLNPDLFTIHKTSATFQSRAQESTLQSNMPSLATHATQAVSEFYYPDSLYPGSEFTTNPKSLFEWQNLQDSILSFQESNQYQMGQRFASPRFETPDGDHTPGKLGEHGVWDCHSIDGPDPAYPSLMCPRNYAVGDEVNMKTLVEPIAQTYSPSSYVIEPRNQQVHQTTVNAQQARRETFQYPRRGTPHSRLGVKSFQRHLSISSQSSPSTTKMSFPSRINLDLNKGCLDHFSPTGMHDEESDGDGSANVEPYAQLIYRALRSAPGHAMVLKDIYEWFENNTDKAKNASSKGWQNSIRHNLSMNGAFKKEDQIPVTDESKKGFIWVLEDSALIDGVKSTTRYRKHNSTKKAGKAEAPAPQRQRSGAKGGKAARKAARMRRSLRMDEPRAFRYFNGNPADTSSSSTTENMAAGVMDTTFFLSDTVPLYLHTSNTTPESPVPGDNHFDYSRITGCAPASPSDPLFYEPLETCNDSMLSCDSFCESEDNLIDCGLSRLS